MKRIFFGIAFGLVAMLAILDSIAPKDFKIEKSVTINQPKSFVFSYLKFLKNENSWNPFLEKDPKVITVMKSTDGVVGAISYWSGNLSVGTGEQEIKNIVEGDKIEFELRLKIPFIVTYQGLLLTEVAGDQQTKVKWVWTGTNSFPLDIIFMYSRGLIEKDLEHGLDQLKAQMEKLTATPEIKL